MIITALKNEITSNLQGDSHSATIELNAITFQALSSTIYKDPIQAIMRELLCNAKDSHIEAGNPDPLLVELPTSLSPQLVIEDFGLGMDHQTVFSVFTNYFSSTKRDSITLTGGFGLGSKTPYAYTDQFTVQATYNGVKRTYAMYKDDINQPKASLVNTEITKAHNGVRITIPIHPKDRDKFHYAAALVTKYLGHEVQGVPVCTQSNQGEYIIDDITVLINATQYNPIIVQAGVAYPAPRTYNSKMTVYVPPGTFKPTLSRESLEEAPAVHDKLLNRINSGISRKLQDVINTATDIKQAIDTLKNCPTLISNQIGWRGINLLTGADIIGFARTHRSASRHEVTGTSPILRTYPSKICIGPTEFKYKHTPAPTHYNDWHLHLYGDNAEKQLKLLGYTGIPVEYPADTPKTKKSTRVSRELQATMYTHGRGLTRKYYGERLILSGKTPILDALRSIFPEIPAPYILAQGLHHNWTCMKLLKLGAYETENGYLADNPIDPNLVAQAIAFYRSPGLTTNLLRTCRVLPGVDMRLLELYVRADYHDTGSLEPLTTSEEIEKETKKLELRRFYLNLKLTGYAEKLSSIHVTPQQYILENL